MDLERLERRRTAAARAHAGEVRRDLAQITAEMKADDEALRRKRDAASAAESAGEDRQVGMQPNPLETIAASCGAYRPSGESALM